MFSERLNPIVSSRRKVNLFQFSYAIWNYVYLCFAYLLNIKLFRVCNKKVDRFILPKRFKDETKELFLRNSALVYTMAQKQP